MMGPRLRLSRLGVNACAILSQDGEQVFESLEHFELRDQTTDILLPWLSEFELGLE